MENFTKSTYEFHGITYNRYTADRKRGTSAWVFYNQVPRNKVYDPIWPNAIKNDAEFLEQNFYSRIEGDIIHVDFIILLGTIEEDALDLLYSTHVAPIPIVE